MQANSISKKVELWDTLLYSHIMGPANKINKIVRHIYLKMKYGIDGADERMNQPQPSTPTPQGAFLITKKITITPGIFTF